MITIKCAMIRKCESRSVRKAYSTVDITRVLDRLGWEWNITPPVTMIIYFEKTFPSKTDAIAGRRELEEALPQKNIFRIDAIIES